MLTVDHLTFKIGNKTLIRNISLNFCAGRLYPVIGSNGSGKTTLLKTIAGIWPPTQGNVLWCGQDLLKKPRREISKIISFVPHNASIPFDFTAEQFVHMGLYSQGLCNTDHGKNCVLESLKTLDALHLRSCSINELSQGERQRILIARSLVTQAPILAFDEPTANVDKKYQALIWKLMEQLISQNKIILIATHDLKNSRPFLENTIALSDGVLIPVEEYEIS